MIDKKRKEEILSKIKELKQKKLDIEKKYDKKLDKIKKEIKILKQSNFSTFIAQIKEKRNDLSMLYI